MSAIYEWKGQLGTGKLVFVKTCGTSDVLQNAKIGLCTLHMLVEIIFTKLCERLLKSGCSSETCGQTWDLSKKIAGRDGRDKTQLCMWSVHTNLFGHQNIAKLLNSGVKDQQEEDSKCQLEFYRFPWWQIILAKKMVLIMVIVIIMIFSTFPSGRRPIVRGKHNCLCGTNTFLQKLLPAVSFLFSSKNAHSPTASLCLKGDCGQAGVQLSLRRDSRSNPA